MVAIAEEMCWLLIAVCSVATLLTAVNAADQSAERSEADNLLQLLMRLETDLKERREDLGHQEEVNGQSQSIGKNNGRIGKMGFNGADEEPILTGKTNGRFGKKGSSGAGEEPILPEISNGGLGKKGSSGAGEEPILSEISNGRFGKKGSSGAGEEPILTGISNGRFGKRGSSGAVEEPILTGITNGRTEKVGTIGKTEGLVLAGISNGRTPGARSGVDEEPIGLLTGISNGRSGKVGRIGKPEGLHDVPTGSPLQGVDLSRVIETLTKLQATGKSSDPAGPILFHVMDLLVTLLNDSLNLSLSQKREADDSSVSSSGGNAVVHRMLQEIGELSYYLAVYDVLTMYQQQPQQQNVTKASRSAAAETVLGRLGVSRIQLSDDAHVDEN